MGAADGFDCDVLIAGGGPTGVTLALLLARRGVSVIVAEKEADIYPLPRAAHLDHETMRILQEAGVADRVMASSRSTARYDFLNAAGDVLLRFEGNDRTAAGGWPSSNMIHQPSVEAALRAELVNQPAARLQPCWDVQNFVDDGTGVTAHIVTPDGERTLRARYLVGADGARSPVREACGIAFEDLGFEEPWLVVDTIVHDSARLPTANLQICNPERPTTCVLMGEGRHRWEFMIRPGEDPAAISTDAAIAALLEPWNVAGAVTLERKAVYTFRARIARQWRKGRVLLAGDAAHQTPPFAGQGMCSGLRDTANLAWKLAAVTRDGAADNLLDSYQPEREPNLRATIEMAIMMGRTVCITDPAAAAMRDAQMLAARAAGHSPDGAVEYPPIATGVILTGSPAAGQYFPQPIAADGARLDDVLGNGTWVIARTDLAAPMFAPFSAPLTAWLDLHDTEAVLVRPDRHVFGTGPAEALRASWATALTPR
jgi:3-(3-hydroxy-phenyl)propionate hydroxylase